MLSCTIDGGYHANNAWVAANNPAGDARLRHRRDLPEVGDPLTVSSPAANSLRATGRSPALCFYAPPDTAITDYKLILRHYWFAPGNGGPDETTYTLVELRRHLRRGTGQFDPADAAGAGERGALVRLSLGGAPSGAADTGAVTRTLSDSTAGEDAAHARPT